MNLKLILVGYIVFLMTVFDTVQSSKDLFVNTKYGRVRGTQTDTANAFLGIPYAQSPVGALRWKPPVPPRSWYPAAYNASVVKSGCPQWKCSSQNPSFACPIEISENCLFLNIWTPLTKDNVSSLPVMVFIHGGNFQHGSGDALLYKGDYFAMKGKVVLVTFNYRLGILGFLYTGKGADDAKGNYGIMDQTLALSWVQENIAAFGGDPRRVTLFGHSAGALSIQIHLMSTESDRLFRNVIIQSAPLITALKQPTEAFYQATLVKKLLNCTINYMQCMRSKSSDAIIEAQSQVIKKPTSLKVLDSFMPIVPVVDGDLIKTDVMSAIQNNKLRNVPSMIGTVSEEVRLFVFYEFKKPLSVEGYLSFLFAGSFPHIKWVSHAGHALLLYPPGPGNDQREILSKLGTDLVFTCPTRNMSRNYLLNSQDGHNVYRYWFDHHSSFGGWVHFPNCNNHVCHGEELSFVFHSVHQSDVNFDKSEEVLSNSMIYYWSNFAYTSDPNTGPHAVDVKWPVYDKQDIVMKLQTPANTVVESYDEKFCNFWDSVGYN